MVLALDTLSCHDNHLCQIIFKSHHAGESYELDTILEYTFYNEQINTHTLTGTCTHTILYALLPFHGGGIKKSQSNIITNPLQESDLFQPHCSLCLCQAAFQPYYLPVPSLFLGDILACQTSEIKLSNLTTYMANFMNLDMILINLKGSQNLRMVCSEN